MTSPPAAMDSTGLGYALVSDLDAAELARLAARVGG